MDSKSIDIDSDLGSLPDSAGLLETQSTGPETSTGIPSEIIPSGIVTMAFMGLSEFGRKRV